MVNEIVTRVGLHWIYSIDRWIDGSTNQLIGSPVGGIESYRECVYEVESEDCVIIGGRSIPFEISRRAIDLVDGAQCKCKRKR